MKPQNSRSIMITLVTILLMLTVYQISSAGCCESHSFAENSTTARAEKEVIKLTSSTWQAVIYSYTDNPALAIDELGWTSWTVFEQCNGQVIDFQSRGGVTVYNKSYRANAFSQAINSCAYLPQFGCTGGNHRFKEELEVWQAGPQYCTAIKQ